MLERDMEELIAKFPDDFFPKKGFVLVGRQVSYPGVGRFDLLFSDHHNRKNLFELKAQPLKIADADQVGRYKTALQERGEKRIIMWLVSPRIPTHVRESLDDFSIEYEEIHIAKFKQVAEEHGISLNDESTGNATVSTATQHATSPLNGLEGETSIRNIVGKLSIPDAVDRAGSLLQKR